MRNTARMQVIALALLGAMAWIAIQTGAVQGAVVGLLGHTAVEGSVGAAPESRGFDMPLLAAPERDDRARYRHPLVIPVGGHLVLPSASRRIWVIPAAPDAFVG